MDKDLQQLAYYASLMRGPVEIRHGGKPGHVVSRLLEAGANIRLVLDSSVPDGEYHVIGESQSQARVIFRGEPAGHEVSSFVLAVLQHSGIEPKMTESQVRRVKSVTKKITFETFYSAECVKCPEVVQSLNAISLLNENISHIATNGFYFKREAAEKNVLAVPAVFKDGVLMFNGTASIDDILDRIGAEAEHEETIKCDVAVVGGGPAGLTAAIYAARKGFEVCVLTDRVGGQLLDTNLIENITGIQKTTGELLAGDIRRQAESYGVRILSGETSGVVRENELFRLRHGKRDVLARSVIAATGARWRRLNVDGEDRLLHKGVTFCPHCDGPLFAGKRVLVVGGGNSGAEAALDLSGTSSHVTLVEIAEKIPADAVLLESLERKGGVELISGAKVVGINGESSVDSVEIEIVSTGARRTIEVDGVFIQAGLVPNTDWLMGFADTNQRGELVVGKKGETSVPGLFAGGDATDGIYKQISTAVSGGAVAAMSAAEYLNSRDNTRLDQAAILV